jgi:hypothetical protein
MNGTENNRYDIFLAICIARIQNSWIRFITASMIYMNPNLGKFSINQQIFAIDFNFI